MTNALAVICGRGGSKGLPRKNVLELGGKPLVAWSVAAALGAKSIGRTILSTDDDEIAAAARQAGCDVPFMRPPELASDTASIYDVLFHALDNAGQTYDMVVLLQATSPLRTSRDIDACIDLCVSTNAPSCISVTVAAKPPHWMYVQDSNGCLLPALPSESQLDRRQDAPVYYLPNGAVYVARTDWLRQNNSFVGHGTRAYLMPNWRSVDVDSYLDLVYARAILAELEKGNLI
ncbi:MAG: acylneuraminate cytidylyltransferase family protein [Alphaproteobacteria bacterium]|nr:acylneuraminate cytidylyltransferase family protein [Alphaproteobacteria bacterium]